jgi:hypothetical protein
VCLWPGCIYTYTSPDELYSHYRFNHKPFGRNHASREDSLGLSGPHRFIEPPSWNTSPECVSSNWFSETLERWKAWKTSESPVHLSILAANELLLVTSSIGSTVVAIDQGCWLRNSNLHPFWLTFLSLIFLVNATFTLSCSRLLLLILPPPFKDISSMSSKWLSRKSQISFSCSMPQTKAEHGESPPSLPMRHLTEGPALRWFWIFAFVEPLKQMLCALMH